jgi:hypothetical protein
MRALLPLVWFSRHLQPQERSCVPRTALLLYLLVHSVPFHVCLAPEDTISLLGKSNHSTTDLVSSTHMGICESTLKYISPHTKEYLEWQRTTVGPAECFQQRVWTFCNCRSQHVEFYCK